jgi:hypothetical protein
MMITRGSNQTPCHILLKMASQPFALYPAKGAVSGTKPGYSTLLLPYSPKQIINPIARCYPAQGAEIFSAQNI